MKKEKKEKKDVVYRLSLATRLGQSKKLSHSGKDLLLLLK